MTLAVLLTAGILALWLDARWPFHLEQVALFGYAGIHFVRKPGWPHWLGIVPAGAVLIGVMQLLAGLTVYAWNTETAVLDWFTRLVVFWLASNVLADDSERRRFLDFIRDFSAALGAAALLLRFLRIEGGAPVGRMGPFLYENQYACFAELTLPFILLDALTGHRVNWRAVVLSAAMIVSVLVSGSVAGVALMVAETVVIVLVAARKGFTARLVVPVCAAAIALAGVTGWKLLSVDLERHDPYRVRREMTQASLAMLHDRPWTGFGLGNWAVAQPAYTLFDDGLFDNQAHNDWAQWAAEGGVPLLLLMLLFAAFVAPAAWRTIWGIGLVAVLLHALVDYPFQQRPALGCLWFALAAAALREKRRS